MSFVQIHLVFSTHIIFQVLEVFVSQKKTSQEMEVITTGALEGIHLFPYCFLAKAFPSILS